MIACPEVCETYSLHELDELWRGVMASQACIAIISFPKVENILVIDVLITAELNDAVLRI